jgi:hypothetical protein
VCNRGNFGVLGEKECKRKKYYDEGGERKQILDGRRGKKVQNVF